MSEERDTAMKNSKSGVALVTVMCFAFIVSALVAGLFVAATTHLRISKDQIYLEQALLAEKQSTKQKLAQF